MSKRLLCAYWLVSALAWAQSYTASVRGEVTDSSHAAVPSATVVLTETTQNVEYKTVTDSAGRYGMPSVPRGRYTLAVEAAGFKKAVQAAFNLEVQQQATFDFEMEVGQVNTAVEVTGSAPLINTTSATLGQVVDNKFIDTMPLSGRNPLTLARLAPGIVGDTGGVNFSANGTRNSTSDVMLDGSIITGIEQNGGITDVKYVPSVDVVQEFNVQTNYFSAEFGNTGGAVINIVSKSGTNDPHGVGYEFHSASALNANTWESNRSGNNLPDSHKDIFGYAFGGPVILPKLYNGRNKTFFFTNYEGQRAAEAAKSPTSQNTVPTAQQLAGDFSNVRLQDGTPVTIYNPFSTFVNDDGETMRNPFSGNRIPASMIDPIALKLTSYFAKPTSDGNPFTHVNNWFAQGTNRTGSNQLAFKIDENISDKQRFSARYTVNWDDSQPFNALGNDANGSLPDTSRTQNGVVDYPRTQNPTTVINLRGGLTRAHERHVPASSFEQTSLGFPSILDYNGVNMFPRITTTGYQSLGVGGYALIWRDEDVYVGSGSVTKILGAHTLKIGAEVRRLHENYFQPNLPQGGFSFNRAQTGQNPLVASSRQGDAVASLLLGWGTMDGDNHGGYSIDLPAATTSGYFGGYLQDDWRITKRLTLNLGLRYDFDIPRTERFDREDWWDP
ncbi:MAG TPA: carboxypeptidase regulatory-like domain-containing protein, partial [Bryobacteraceae bacterium]|nr:carboxypeptidase regulatory-like domain-containing protein [Bryobacteraceae bacterium]